MRGRHICAPFPKSGRDFPKCPPLLHSTYKCKYKYPPPPPNRTPRLRAKPSAPPPSLRYGTGFKPRQSCCPAVAVTRFIIH